MEPVNQHFLLLRIVHEYVKSPPRNPGLFGREHLIVIKSSLWIRPRNLIKDDIFCAILLCLIFTTYKAALSLVHKSSKWGQPFFLFLLPQIAQESEKLWGKILYRLITTIFTLNTASMSLPWLCSLIRILRNLCILLWRRHISYLHIPCWWLVGRGMIDERTKPKRNYPRGIRTLVYSRSTMWCIIKPHVYCIVRSRGFPGISRPSTHIYGVKFRNLHPYTWCTGKWSSIQPFHCQLLHIPQIPTSTNVHICKDQIGDIVE